METEENTHLTQVVDATESSPLKAMIVDYVGNKLQPANDEVTLQMLVEVVAEEFPEFVLSLAEENWIRGYSQALDDVEQAAMAQEQKE